MNFLLMAAPIVALGALLLGLQRVEARLKAPVREAHHDADPAAAR